MLLRRAAAFVFIAALAAGFSIDCGAASAERLATGAFSFVPNQIASAQWYRPGGSLVNGHIDESFGAHPEKWETLRESLKKCGGSFSIFASEIGHMSQESGLIAMLKNEGVSISVEMPGFTQEIDGNSLAEAELNGLRAGGADNIFARIFRLEEPSGRPDPDGLGWFVTKDGRDFVPDEIIFDERVPNLCPEIDPAVLASAKGAWEERKRAAKKSGAYAAKYGSFNGLLDAVIGDYIAFLRAAKTKWGYSMPLVGLHWNVNPGWEWRDENGWDAIHAADPAYFDDPKNFWAIVQKRPQYNSVKYLERLVDAMTAAGFKPARIYMDADWTYDIPYITEVLKRHKASLKGRGIQMGVNVVEASIPEDAELVFENGTLKIRQGGGASKNELYENTLVAIAQFLVARGIYESGMHLRIGSWTHRPYEKGLEIDENIPGSLAHAANEIIGIIESCGASGGE